MSVIAITPAPPYYAVIFTSLRTDGDGGYGKTAVNMLNLAAQQPGFLGVESARENIGITVSYWTDLNAIQKWKENAEHLIAQKCGRKQWYHEYHIRIAKIEHAYTFKRNNNSNVGEKNRG